MNDWTGGTVALFHAPFCHEMTSLSVREVVIFSIAEDVQMEVI